MSRAESRPFRVAVAGCGTVGGALLRRLLDGPEVRGRPVTVARVLARRATPGRIGLLPAGALTTELHHFLQTPADLVVEAIGGLEPAATIARHVLSRGGRLVTANKLLVATHGEELAILARRSGGWFGFDAAVGGGVPVVRALQGALRDQPVGSIRGILNGTANFVLTRLEEGADLAGAVRQAREQGLAEVDASRDLDGRDVADKLSILAWVAWGVAPRLVPVRREGLPRDVAAQARHAIQSGGRLRLVGECRRDAAGITASVRPEVVPAASSLGRTVEAQNRVEIEVGWEAPVELAGPGAGGEPTASALWHDLVDAGAGE
jgi:homoserine dehydrogenase